MSDVNPVFHYRARFRTAALFAQKTLLLGGLLLMVIGVGGTLLANTTERLHTLLQLTAVAGVLSFIIGIAWGIFWRVHLRNDFRKTFAPHSVIHHP